MELLSTDDIEACAFKDGSTKTILRINRRERQNTDEARISKESIDVKILNCICFYMKRYIDEVAKLVLLTTGMWLSLNKMVRLRILLQPISQIGRGLYLMIALLRAHPFLISKFLRFNVCYMSLKFCNVSLQFFSHTRTMQ